MLKRSTAVLALAFGCIAVSGPAHATCRWTLVDGKQQQICDRPEGARATWGRAAWGSAA